MPEELPQPTTTHLETLNDSELRLLLSRCQAELGRRAVASPDAETMAKGASVAEPSERIIISEDARANMLPEDEMLIRAFYTADDDTVDFVFELDESDR